MGKILLVRHGQDTDNAAGILNGRRDTSLTQLGREQSKKVAEKLRGSGIQIIYTSPLRRAYETARIIAAELGVDEIIADEHLVERDFGALTGKEVSKIPSYVEKTYPTDKVDYFLEAEGAEDFPTLLGRSKKILEEIRERHPSEDVLVVTHGDIGKMLCAAYHGWSWEQGLKAPYFDNTEVLELADSQDVLG